MVGSILTGIITVGGIISAATISEVVGPILMVSGFVSYASFLGVSTRAYHYYIWCNKKYQNEINDQISNYNDIKKKKQSHIIFIINHSNKLLKNKFFDKIN